MKQFEEYFILPQSQKDSEPSWFGFILSIKDNKINREDLLRYLEKEKIGSRLLFGGNIARQPYFVGNENIKYRSVGKLANTDFVMNNTFWIGLYPGISKNDIDSIVKSFVTFLSKR